MGLADHPVKVLAKLLFLTQPVFMGPKRNKVHCGAGAASGGKAWFGPSHHGREVQVQGWLGDRGGWDK